MRYWVIIALACLANASELPKDEKVTSSSSSVEELGSRFGSASIGETIIKALKKLLHPDHNHHPLKQGDLSGSKNKRNILDTLKFDVARGRDSKRENSEFLDLLRLIAVFGKDSLGKQGAILKILLGLNKANIIQKAQRGDDFGINLDKIMPKTDSQSLKQGINLQQGSQTSNVGDSFENILREIFAGGSGAGNSGAKGIGNGVGRGANNGGGRGLGNGGSRDISNGGGRGLSNGGTRDTSNGGVGGISTGGGKGIRDGGLFGDGGFGGNKSGDGRSKSGDNFDGKNFNNEEDLFLFTS